MDDAISRQAAIDAVRATLLSWSYMPEWRDNKIIEAVEQLPTIQPTDKLQKLADEIASFKRRKGMCCLKGQRKKQHDVCTV